MVSFDSEKQEDVKNTMGWSNFVDNVKARITNTSSFLLLFYGYWCFCFRVKVCSPFLKLLNCNFPVSLSNNWIFKDTFVVESKHIFCTKKEKNRIGKCDYDNQQHKDYARWMEGVDEIRVTIRVLKWRFVKPWLPVWLYLEMETLGK